MKKEGLGNYLNSNGGKVNIVLLFSLGLIFVLSVVFVNAAITITQLTPRPNNVNASRSINFTFTVTWGGEEPNLGNCSIFTNITGTLAQTIVNSSNGTSSAIYNSSTAVSWINVTFGQDNRINWTVRCSNATNTGGFNVSTDNNLTIDATPPQIIAIAPNNSLSLLGLFFAPGFGTGNFTSYPTFQVNVSDNNTAFVWYILNSTQGTTLTPLGFLENFSAGATNNITMVLDAGATSGISPMNLYKGNLSLNFTSPWRGPGPHSVVFCANDTAGNQKCSGSYDFVVEGGNVTELENTFTNFAQGAGGSGFGGLNVTFGNGTEIPTSTFFNPVTGTTMGDFTYRNFTFIMNFSSSLIIQIVGFSIDESIMGNASNARFNSTSQPEVRTAVGDRYSQTMGWMDIRSFLPDAARYEYGVIQIAGTGYSKHMYCNGTSQAVPNCGPVSQCSGTVFNVYNNSVVIPANSACWLESGVVNGQTLAAGFTYMFVDHFSGAVGAADFGQPNATVFTPTDLTNVSTPGSRLINFSVDDTDSTGMNLSMNYSVNVSVTLGGSQLAFFAYLNTTATNVSCYSPLDSISIQNTTKIYCNLTFNFASNGTYVVNITGRDTSNNSNAMNVTTSFTRLTVDNIPPIFSYVNFTNASTFNASGSDSTGAQSVGLGTTAGTSRAQGDAVTGIIYAVANWTDNLTTLSNGLLQVYNGTWQTLNVTNVTPNNNGGWTNFSYPIASGHNLFEGANISFRIIANDSVGNINNSNSVRNFTIQINDTTKPTLLVSRINGIEAANNSNVTTATPSIFWNITEGSALAYIAIQVDTQTDPNCGQFKNFTTVSTTATKRNGSITVLDVDSGCTPLTNGSHTVRLTAQDTWGNSELYIHTFTLQNGVAPIISLNGLGIGSTTFGAVNTTNLTTGTGLNFSATVASTTTLKNLSFTSDCNATGGTFAANATIKPFQGACAGTSGNKTITVTAADFAGNSVTNTFVFFIDDVAPSIAVWSPLPNQRLSNNVSLNWSVLDGAMGISFTGYYLDAVLIPATLNFTSGSSGQGGAAINMTDSRPLNFTPGQHTIKFTANDTLGNSVNSSPITFSVNGPINFQAINLNGSTGIRGYNVNVLLVNLTNASGAPLYDTTGIVTDQLLNLSLVLQLNQTQGLLVNVTLVFNASAANWDKTNFSVTINSTTVINSIKNNQTENVIQAVTFNGSLNDFISDADYFGTVRFPMNATSTDIGRTVKIQWFDNVNNLKNATNITQCTSSFTPTIAGVTSPCWSNTGDFFITVFVPHFSHVVIANDTIPPTVIINSPVSAQPVISFAPNVTVSDDTLNCSFSYNASSGSQSTPATMTLAEGPTISTCTASSAITDLTNGTTVNITFNVYDTSLNLNQTSLLFTVSDLTQHTAAISDSGGSTTGTTVSLIANESVNMSVIYGAATSGACTTLGSTATPATTFAKSPSVGISLSTVSSATVICYNVTSCDKAGNCLVNGTFNFTQSATSSSAAASSSSSGGGGGSAAGATPTTTANVAASSSRQWDSIEAGTEGTLIIHNADIAIMGVIISIKNTVSNPSLTVSSLTSNSESTEAAAKVYQYLQITKSNIADSDTSKIAITFAVPKSWLTSNSVNADDIALYRFSDGKWNALPTTKTGEDSLYFMYQSTTPGFSTFAVGNKEAAPAAPPSAPVAQPAAPPSAPAAPPSAPVAQPAAPSGAKGGLSSTAIAWIVVAVIIVVAGIGYFMMKKKQGGE